MTQEASILKKISKMMVVGLLGMSALTTAVTEASSIQPVQDATELKTAYNVVDSYGYSEKLADQISNLNLNRLDTGNNVIWMEATGYSRFDPGCGDYTATGEFLHYGIAAVDPNVIPLGTNLYVEGYGQALAADTGGAIVGNRIDLAFESHQEALNWGRRGVNVYY